MKTEELDYELPDNLIAQEPLAIRDSSRLMVVDRESGEIRHEQFRSLPEFWTPGDLLVRNTSRVVPARLHGRRATGGRVELLVVRRLAGDRWLTLVRPAARLRHAEAVTLDGGLVVTVEGPAPDDPGQFIVVASDLDAHMQRHGAPPLPPYIRRAPGAGDRDRYQTVYATAPGSSAAPTAGLHFTPPLLARLVERGIALADVTLHVGPGTFLPVRVDRLEDHRMHSEPFEVGAATAERVNRTLAAGRQVLAVGTTTARCLESARSPSGVEPRVGLTDLFVLPGHEFASFTALLTNFHQPRSTLLALVGAFTGMELLTDAYRIAVAERYRFLSYGDAMLIR